MFIRLFTLLWLLTACAPEAAQESASQDKPTADEQAAVDAMMDTLTGEHLQTQIPDGWARIRDSKTANLHISEYIPANTQGDWQEKLSIEALQGEGLPDPIDFLNGWAHDQAQLCDEFVDSPIFAGMENGYEAIVRLLECRINKRTQLPIVTMIKVIRADEALYTITRIWRLSDPAVADEPLSLNPKTVGRWSDVLRETMVCNPQDDAHPCM